MISFSWSKEHMVCLILLSNVSDVLLAFNCARYIGNLWSIHLGANILRLEWSEKSVPSIFIGNIFSFKNIKNSLSPSSKNADKFLRIFCLAFYLDLTGLFSLNQWSQLRNYFSLSASLRVTVSLAISLPKVLIV